MISSPKVLNGIKTLNECTKMTPYDVLSHNTRVIGRNESQQSCSGRTSTPCTQYLQQPSCFYDECGRKHSSNATPELELYTILRSRGRSAFGCEYNLIVWSAYSLMSANWNDDPSREWEATRMPWGSMITRDETPPGENTAPRKSEMAYTSLEEWYKLGNDRA